MGKVLNGYYLLLFFLCTFYVQFNIYSQERGKIFSKYFSQREYKAGEQNWDIAQDKNGILYFGNQDGLLQYDGEYWEKFPISNKSTIRTVEIDNKGLILVGGYNELGYFNVGKKGQLVYHSLINLIDSSNRDLGDVWNIEIINETWYFQTDKYLFGIRNGKCKTWFNFGELIYYNYKFNNELYLQVLGKGLYKLVNDSFVLAPNGDFFADKKISTILPFKDIMLICTRSNGLYLYNQKNKSARIISLSDFPGKKSELNQFLARSEIYTGIKIEEDKFALSTTSGGVIVINTDFEIVDIINKESTGISGSSFYVFYDFDGNLWMAMDNGIQKVELSTPFRYWDSETGLKGSCFALKLFDNTIFNATGHGVYMLEKENINNKFTISKFKPVLNYDDQVWTLMVIDPNTLSKKRAIGSLKGKILANYPINKKTLVASTNGGLFEIGKEGSKKILSYSNLYSTCIPYSDSTKIYLGLTKGLARIRYINGLWFDEGMLEGNSQQISSLGEDSKGNLWFTSDYKGVSCLKSKYLDESVNPDFSGLNKYVERFDSKSGLPIQELVFIGEMKHNLKFYTRQGEYVFNYDKNSFEKDKSIGTNYLDSTWKNEIYINDKKGFWINAIEKYKKNGFYYADSVIVKRLKNHALGETIRDSLNRVWIGMSDGILCCHEKYQKNYYREFPAIIRKVILSNDSVIYYGINYTTNTKSDKDKYAISSSTQVEFLPEISYKQSEINFVFASTFYDSDVKNQYSCFLEGYDKEWSSWSGDTKKSYTNLPAGKYLFRVKAKNIYDVVSNEASFSFRVKAPWYLTWWAYISIILVVGVIIFFIAKIYSRELIKKNDQLERIVQLRTREILSQKEEILLQTEYLKEINEEVKTKNEELVKRKNQLEESEATRNKFFKIIAHDLRNPISSFVNFTNFILENYDEFEPQRTKVIINELNKVSQTTFNLLENLLEWSTSQMGEIRYVPQKINLSALIGENIELINHRLQTKMINLKHSMPTTIEVYADKNMVNTIVRNLLSNAVKFTYEGGEISISHEISDNYCWINIADSGIGMSENEINRLFKIDKHFSNMGTQNEKGSGLGLILCKDFIEKNGGTLSIDSKPGKGSTFTFCLPNNQS
jgi:signal transduction histidine kinase